MNYSKQIMKLQKIHAYNYGDKSHYKYVITLPEELISALGWETGSELEAKKKDNGFKVSFVAKPSSKPKKVLKEFKMPYSEFREKIRNALEYKDDGATWTELRDQLELEQVVPNNKWVRQLEKDIGLKRIRDMNGVVWRISHV